MLDVTRVDVEKLREYKLCILDLAGYMFYPHHKSIKSVSMSNIESDELEVNSEAHVKRKFRNLIDTLDSKFSEDLPLGQNLNTLFLISALPAFNQVCRALADCINHFLWELTT